MLWDWFTQKLSVNVNDENRAAQMPELIAYLNQKYGDFEYAKDARALDRSHEFEAILKNLIARVQTGLDGATPSVLIAGANTGTELTYVGDFEITALDLSDAALARLAEQFPDVHTFRGDMQALPFESKSFDLYFSMRSIHASNLQIERALEESLRVTRKFLIYSISNGYNLQGQLVKGMYDYDTGKIDAQLPYKHLETVKHFLDAHGCGYQIYEVPSEIIIFSEMPQQISNQTRD